MSEPTTVLARITLNPYSREARRDLNDAEEMHRTLMRLVPDHLGDQPRAAAGLLYRVEAEEDHTAVLVQAAGPLTPERLPAGYGQVQVRDLAPMFAALRKGLAVRYRIVVNPVKQTRLPLQADAPARKRPRGPLVPLLGPDADAWWLRRATEAGLDVRSLVPVGVPAVGDRRNGRRRAGGQEKESASKRHVLYRYDGTAIVTDPQLLTQALRSGIGRGKSYGAGLLSLAPARGA